MKIVDRLYQDIQRIHNTSNGVCKLGIPEGVEKKLEDELRMLFHSKEIITAEKVKKVYANNH